MNNTSCIVFCNSVKSSRAVCYAIEENYEQIRLKSSSLHGDMPSKMRDKNYDDFLFRKT